MVRYAWLMMIYLCNMVMFQFATLNYQMVNVKNSANSRMAKDGYIIGVIGATSGGRMFFPV